jgi:RimJ/RimL family protein N-acetyltransferase
VTAPVRLADRAFTPDEARAVVAWSYEGPFDFYGLSGDDAVVLLLARDERGQGYYPVLEGDDLVGFVCFGAEARVHGQEERAGTCDIGAGLDPTRLSEGIATSLVPAAVRFAVDRFGATRVRAAVAAFNDRSLRLCASAGFRRVRGFEGPAGRPFVELELDLGRRPS